ncbi:MAG: response regulator transcription factor [Lachnospiraceae bacterium]|nr:response regulator transcription factor [Lachnospiraceae bacterium]
MAIIYIVEDDRNIREIETIALKNSGYTVEAFELAKPFYRRLDERTPDLVLLDVMLPDEDGLDILKKLRNRGDTKKLPILMVTAKSTELDKVRGLDMGADDYLSKPFGVMELVSRVKALLRRTMADTEEKFYRLGDIFMDGERRMAYVKDAPIELTFKEYELLKYLISNQGIVLTREQIMGQVWGTYFEGETRTVDMHIKTLRQKLQEEGARIRTVRNVGYVIE